MYYDSGQTQPHSIVFYYDNMSTIVLHMSKAYCAKISFHNKFDESRKNSRL